jgi:hypothetical protein
LRVYASLITHRFFGVILVLPETNERLAVPYDPSEPERRDTIVPTAVDDVSNG